MLSLEENFKYHWNHGVRNIDCGCLRGVGKTTLLKKIIKNFKLANPDKKIVIISGFDNIKDSYRRLLYEGIIDIEICIKKSRCFESLRNLRDIMIFSDDVENIIPKLNEHGLRKYYVCGFYSSTGLNHSDIIRERQNLNIPSDMLKDIEEIKRKSKYEFINATQS